ncbi:hypothetical protein [Natrarchaeobius oligotrophus]|uniref:DUF8108 domain-containing protein n=1 Tax=Natrarchaeobius chitinivorans TaxID=1679083 RepID=A0A3N6NKE3_NATCH|nr:hypothetical protein [Natrarchaeobius chitinivorans]RQG99702.1 hypothetical protein EA472_13695 [Natrarchaeobius chitinivorans]
MSRTPETVALAERVSRVLFLVAGWLAIAFGAVVAGGAVVGLRTAGTSADSLLLAGFMFAAAFVFVSLGVLVSPPFRRRLRRRRPISRFGRIRTLERRAFDNGDDSFSRCDGCRSPIESGRVRLRREEYAIAGVPVYTVSTTRERYCRTCSEYADSRGDRPRPSADRV